MTASALRELHLKRPFAPFTINLADGRKIPVPHNDFLSLPPKGRHGVVWDDKGGIAIFDVFLVTAVDMGLPRKKRISRPR